MKKYLLLFLILSSCSLSAAWAQSKKKRKEVVYFDQRFRKIKESSKARYVFFPDTAAIQTVYYYDVDPPIVFAKGRVWTADSLTFDGEVRFYGTGNYQCLRQYRNGEMQAPIFINELYDKKPRENATCYLIVDDKNRFHAYRMGYKYPKMTVDKLFATGTVSDTSTLRLEGLYQEIDVNGYLKETRKYKNGVVMPFYESTMDLNVPYTQIELVTYATTVGDLADVKTAYKKFAQQCRDSGADGVIGVRTSISTEYGESDRFYNVIFQGMTILLK